MFKVKRKPDGSVDRFKAHLVSKGYNQHLKLGYKDIFNPVVKPATIRTIVSIVIVNGWKLRQLDISNAFLHGSLLEIVYMVKSPVFKDPYKLHHVCWLRKIIYGLKQAPRAWYNTLKNALLQLSFDNFKVDSSLFIYKKESLTCCFLFYVDEIVITRNNSHFMASIINKLGARFSLKKAYYTFCSMWKSSPLEKRLFLF